MCSRAECLCASNGVETMQCRCMGPGYRFEFKTCASAGTEDGAVYQYLRYDGVQTSGQVTVRNGQ